jgi:hypothetical protein
MLAANDPGGAVFSMIYSLLARVSGGSAEAKACLFYSLLLGTPSTCYNGGVSIWSALRGIREKSNEKRWGQLGCQLGGRTCEESESGRFVVCGL